MQRATQQNMENLYNQSRLNFRLERNVILSMDENDLKKWINSLPSKRSHAENKLIMLISRQIKNRLAAKRSRQKFKNELESLRSQNLNYKSQIDKLGQTIELKNTIIKQFLDIFHDQNQLITTLSKELGIYKSPHNVNKLPITLTPSIQTHNSENIYYNE